MLLFSPVLFGSTQKMKGNSFLELNCTSLLSILTHVAPGHQNHLYSCFLNKQVTLSMVLELCLCNLCVRAMMWTMPFCRLGFNHSESFLGGFCHLGIGDWNHILRFCWCSSLYPTTIERCEYPSPPTHHLECGLNFTLFFRAWSEGGQAAHKAENLTAICGLSTKYVSIDDPPAVPSIPITIHMLLSFQRFHTDSNQISPTLRCHESLMSLKAIWGNYCFVYSSCIANSFQNWF